MSKKLISYSGTTLLQVDLARAKALAVKNAEKDAKAEKDDKEKAAKEKKIKEDKVFEAVALKKSDFLTLRPPSTEEVSDDELAVIKAQMGEIAFKRLVQVHHDAPKVPRSLRKGEAKKTEPVPTPEPEPETKKPTKVTKPNLKPDAKKPSG